MSALPASDGDIIYQRRQSYQKPKVKSKCRHQPTERKRTGRAIIFEAGSLWEIIFANFHQRKGFLCLVLFRELQTGRRVSERKTAVALLFLLILQETRAISFMRCKEEICCFMAKSHIIAACTVCTTESEIMGYFFSKLSRNPRN